MITGLEIAGIAIAALALVAYLRRERTGGLDALELPSPPKKMKRRARERTRMGKL